MEVEEEEIYLYPWDDPKNEGKVYTVEEAKEALGPIVNADDMIEKLQQQGIVETPRAMEVEEEELYLFPWNDPKNEGRVFTEEEAREALGPLANREQIIRQLKEEGIVAISNQEKMEIVEEEYEDLEHTSTLSPYERGGNKNREEIPITEFMTRDEKLDAYYNNILYDGFDKNGLEMISSMLDNIHQIQSLIADNFDGQVGSWADINRMIQDYSLQSLEDVYSYMIDSTIPAMETLKKLTETLKKRYTTQEDLELKKSTYERELNNEPDETELMEQKDRWRDQSGNFHEAQGLIRVNSVKHYEWVQRCENLRQQIKELEQKLEELSAEAEGYLKQIEDYSNQTIAFKDILFE